MKQSSFEKSLDGKQDWPPKKVKNPVLTDDDKKLMANENLSELNEHEHNHTKQ